MRVAPRGHGQRDDAVEYALELDLDRGRRVVKSRGIVVGIVVGVIRSLIVVVRVGRRAPAVVGRAQLAEERVPHVLSERHAVRLLRALEAQPEARGVVRGLELARTQEVQVVPRGVPSRGRVVQNRRSGVPRDSRTDVQDAHLARLRGFVPGVREPAPARGPSDVAYPV